MSRISKKTKSIIAIVLAGLMIIGGSFAYFTDYATTNASGTAGTVAVSLDSGINLLDAEGRDILNPGDMRDAGFTVTNEGNKSIDVRTTVALTALDRDGAAKDFTGTADTQSEFDLYLRSDVDLVEGYGYQPKADAKPLEVKSINGNVITYAIEDYILDGNSDRYDEVETVDGVNAFAKTSDYVLVFKGEAGNDWQAATITMDVLVEAKQHENTGAGWDIVAQESVTTGSITKDTVLAEDVITTDAPAAVAGEYKVLFLNGEGAPAANAEVQISGTSISGENDHMVQGTTDAEGYLYLSAEDVAKFVAAQEAGDLFGEGPMAASEFGSKTIVFSVDTYEYTA